MYAAGALTVLADDDKAVLTAIHNAGAVLSLTKHYQELTEFDFLAKDAIAMVREGLPHAGHPDAAYSHHDPQALQRMSTCQALHEELVAPEALDVLLDLLLHGDECCRAHAAEAVANLATDEVGIEALAAGEQWIPALVELVHAGTPACQEQGMWALHNLVGARLAVGDARVAAQLRGVEAVVLGVDEQRLASSLLGLVTSL